jgi:hypothetical protein
MAIETHTVVGVGTVTADVTGTVRAVQSGGPAGAYHLVDDNGEVNLSIEGVGRGQVFAALAAGDAQAVAAAFNA